MPATRAWDETSPAGTDLVSSLDNTIRNKLVDVRERAAVDHVWNVSQADDGKHKGVTLKPDNDTDEIKTDSAASTTGSGVTGLINLARTFNTTGLAKLILITLTNTASAAGSLFFDFVVGSTSILSLTVAGVLKFAYLQNYREVVNALGTGTGALAIDCRDGNIVTLDNTGARTITLTNPPTAGFFSLRLIITAGVGATSGWTWTLAGTVHFFGGAPSLTTTSGKVDVIDIWTVDGGTNWFVVPAAQNA